jgi:hypothetical protein
MQRRERIADRLERTYTDANERAGYITVNQFNFEAPVCVQLAPPTDNTTAVLGFIGTVLTVAATW